MLQILVLPVSADFTLVPMDEEEAAEREMRGRRIHASRDTLAADSTYREPTLFSTAHTATFFAPRRRKQKDNSITEARTRLARVRTRSLLDSYLEDH
jgi:hypothetical protein